MEVSDVQSSVSYVRELSEAERQKLEQDNCLVSEFKQKKLETEAQKNWDLFYKRNTTKFFKDRHWTTREFEDLIADDKKSDGDSFSSCSKRTLFEVGCGVGNFMFPLMSEDPNMYFYACDFSPRAVDFVKASPQYDTCRCTAFQCDITKTTISTTVPSSSVDIATLIFVLSAIHPDKMIIAMKNIADTLKPNGIILFRDYGLYDHAMLRFSKGHKLSDSFYVRQDGTRAYYFSLEMLDSVMTNSGLERVHSTYIRRSTVNKKEGVDVPRIFVQAKYRKVTNVAKSEDSTYEPMETCCDIRDDNKETFQENSISSVPDKEGSFKKTMSEHFNDSCKI